MMKNVFRAVGLALLLGCAAVSGTQPFAADAAHAATIRNPAVAKAMQEAQNLAKQRRWREAIAKAREADAVSGKSAAEAAVINQFIAYAAVQGGDYGTALNTYDKMIAAGQIDRTTGLKTAMQLALTMGNASRAMQYANQLGGTGGVGKLAFASLYYQQGNYREVIRLLRPGAESSGADALEMLRSAYYRVGDREGAQYALELLVRTAPTPQRWRDLLRAVEQRPGITDHQLLDVYRLKFAVGAMQGEPDYSLLAKLALQFNLPNEAKTVLTKAFNDKVLSGPRNQRLLDVATEQAAKNKAQLAAIDARAKASADGEADIRLGELYGSWNRSADAVTAIQRGIKKDKLKDADEAKIRLGQAFLAQGNRGEALRAFNSVPRASMQSPIARLWSIYASR
ncbi:MAG: tetratricopeptide repeat protein [Alphaproteobacteria bacterium]